MQVIVQQIGPGMVQQIQTVCPECKGQGERINPKDRCDNCNGCKVVREKKIIEVHVDKGKSCVCVLCPQSHVADSSAEKKRVSFLQV